MPRKELYQRNVEKYRQYGREYYKKNAAKLNERKKIYKHNKKINEKISKFETFKSGLEQIIHKIDENIETLKLELK